MYVLAHLHTIVFIPVAVFAFMALLAAAVTGFTEWRGHRVTASTPVRSRPVLVDDRSRPVLVRSRIGGTTRTGVAVRMI